MFQNVASGRYCAIHKNGLGVPCILSKESLPLSLQKHIELFRQERLPLSLKNGQINRQKERNRQETLPLSHKIGRMDRQSDKDNLTGKYTLSVERMDRWTDGRIEII